MKSQKKKKKKSVESVETSALLCEKFVEKDINKK